MMAKNTKKADTIEKSRKIAELSKTIGAKTQLFHMKKAEVDGLANEVNAANKELEKLISEG